MAVDAALQVLRVVLARFQHPKSNAEKPKLADHVEGVEAENRIDARADTPEVEAAEDFKGVDRPVERATFIESRRYRVFAFTCEGIVIMSKHSFII